MMFKRLMAVVAAGLFTSTAMGSVVFTEVNPSNTVPGVVANGIITDSGNDLVFWSGAALKIDLTAGSVYNDLRFESDGVQDNLWPFAPELEFDSWVGVPSSGANGIAGGAGDLGGGPQNIGGTGVDAVSVTWFCGFCTLPRVVQIGNISLSDDAVGSWTLFVTFITYFAPISEVPPRTRVSGAVLNGVMVPEPGVLALSGVFGLAWLGLARSVR